MPAAAAKRCSCGRRRTPKRHELRRRSRHPQTRYDGPATIEERENTDVATTQPVVKFTYEDYLTTPADERYELLDGDLIMVPAPNLKHQHVLGNLHYHLRQFITEHGTGRLFLAPCDVFLSDSNVVQPDLLFVSREREHLLSDGEKVRGAPDLVVEILSPSTADKDRGSKRELYGRHGVAEYWLVDPIAETVSIHRQRGGVLSSADTFSRGQTLRSPLLAGLELRLNDVFSS